MAVRPPNFTQVPNDVLDTMADMEESELRVVLAICRQTFGWHKVRNRLSLTQLEKITGMSRTAVQAGITAGMARGTIERVRCGSQGFEYRVLVVSDYQSTETTSSFNDTEPVASGYQQLVASDYSQKKELKKEIKEKAAIDRAREKDPPIAAASGDRIDPEIVSRLKALTYDDGQIRIIVAAAVPRGGFTLADVELGERWLDEQRPEWTGKFGKLYTTWKAGDVPVLARSTTRQSGASPARPSGKPTARLPAQPDLHWAEDATGKYLALPDGSRYEVPDYDDPRLSH